MLKINTNTCRPAPMNEKQHIPFIQSKTTNKILANAKMQIKIKSAIILI